MIIKNLIFIVKKFATLLTTYLVNVSFHNFGQVFQYIFWSLIPQVLFHDQYWCHLQCK